MELDEARAVQSIVASRTHELMGEHGIGKSEAAKMAVAEYGEEFSEAMSAFSKYQHKLRKMSPDAGQPRDGNGRPLQWNSLYREWLESHDWVPQDSALAHFTGASAGAFQSARRTLISEGWEFEKEGHLWVVVKRPTRGPSQSEVQNAAEQAAKDAYRRVMEGFGYSSEILATVKITSPQ